MTRAVKIEAQDVGLRELIKYFVSHIRLYWWLSGKESACNAGGMGSIPGLGRSPGFKEQYQWQEVRDKVQ